MMDEELMKKVLAGHLIRITKAEPIRIDGENYYVLVIKNDF